MSHQCHIVQNHRQLQCLFNSLFKLKTKKTVYFSAIAPMWGVHLGLVDSLHKWPNASLRHSRGATAFSRVNFPASFSNLLQPFLSQDLRKLWLWGTILSNMWIHGPLMSRTVVLLDFFRRFTSFSFFLAHGNVTVSAEFNFYCDPEAAHVVLSELVCPVTLCGWETCQKFEIPWVSICLHVLICPLSQGTVYIFDWSRWI